VSINEATIEYGEEGDITTTGIEEAPEPQKRDSTHVQFTLPFQLTPDMIIAVRGAVELIIPVTDYYKKGSAKFKMKSIFDSSLFPDGSNSLPDELESVISLSQMITGSALIGAEEEWTKMDDKHWEYKE